MKQIPIDELLEKVRGELVRYEHPLFEFSALTENSAGGGGEVVAVEIRFRPARDDVHNYRFQLHARDIEHPQFPWTFQRQLYDCLHDYIIEMFTSNPQREN